MNPIDECGGSPEIPARQGSIAAGFLGADSKRFFPLHLWKDGTISLSLIWLHSRPQLKSETARAALLDSLTVSVGSTNPRNLRGLPAFPVNNLADAETLEAFRIWLENALPSMA